MREPSEEALRERIETTRSRMSETVEEIGVRVNPDRVQRELKARARGEVDQFKASVKQKARSTMRDLEHEAEERGRGVWQAIKDNPVPATMVGVGLGWIIANGRSERDGETHRARGGAPAVYGASQPYRAAYVPSRGYTGAPPRPRDEWAMGEESEGTLSEARDRAEHVADEARERGEELLDRAQDEVEDAADTAREKTSELADDARQQARQVRNRAAEWTDRVEHRAMRAERRVEESVRDNPLAAGAMAAALGFAAGMMVPESQREHEMFGDTRDRVMKKARRSARSAADSARETVRETAADAARHAVDETLGAGSDNGDGAMTEPGME